MQLKRPTVIVVGTGRSGTSTVAKILHEDLGICMGHFLKPGGPANPDGFYEDFLSHGLVRMLRTNDLAPETYLSVMNESHKDCRFWGAKDPWFLYTSKEVRRELKPALCIICERDFKQTMNSWAKLQGGQFISQSNMKAMEKLTQERMVAMHGIGVDWPIMRVDFSTHKDPDQLRENIRYMLNLQGVPGF